MTLLAPDEPDAVEVLRPGGTSDILLVADHAGRRIPRSLGDLGLPPSELSRHIAWDIGIRGVTERLAAALDATVVMQRYSRLVIDCNRPPSAPSSIPTLSEATSIPGNVGLGAPAAAARRDAIFAPYHDAITRALDSRAGRHTVLVAMHSFTPSYLGVARPWHVGLLYLDDARLAHPLLRRLRAHCPPPVGDNEPYRATRDSDYALPVHGQDRGLAHVGIEIRQDLIADDGGQAAWAALLARLLPEAVQDVERSFS